MMDGQPFLFYSYIKSYYMIVHSSIPFEIISIYPSIEHKDKIAVLIVHPDGRQEVLYILH